MTELLGFIMMCTPIIFVISITIGECDVFDAIKATIVVDLLLAIMGIGILLMTSGGLKS